MKNEKIPLMLLISGLGVGGAERVVICLAGALQRRGYSPVIVSLTSRREILTQYSDLSCQVHVLNMDGGVLAILKSLLQLLRLSRVYRPKIIHAHMIHGLLAGLICKLLVPGVKLVFTSHNFLGFSLPRRFFIWATKFLRDVDVVFSPSQHNSLNKKITRVIPNGTHVATIERCVSKTLPPEKFVFLFLGRLEAAKNPIGLIEIFSGVNDSCAELWLAGDGYLRQDVERRIRELGLEDRVTMLGICEDVPTLLNKVDCLVLPSLWEGLPMVILEAGAQAVPVISSPVGAIPEVLADEAGYLANLETFSSTMSYVVANPHDAVRRGRKLRDKIEKYYSVNCMVEAHDDLYQLLVCKKMEVL